MESLEVITRLEQKLQELEKKHERLKQHFYASLGFLVVLFMMVSSR
jgi:hypothetical protein